MVASYKSNKHIVKSVELFKSLIKTIHEKHEDLSMGEIYLAACLLKELTFKALPNNNTGQIIKEASISIVPMVLNEIQTDKVKEKNKLIEDEKLDGEDSIGPEYFTVPGNNNIH